MIRAWKRLLAWWRKFRTPVRHTGEGTPQSTQPTQPSQPPPPGSPPPWSSGAPDTTLEWARATGYAYFNDRDWSWLPFIIRLKSGGASKFWEAVDRLEQRKVLRIPSPYRASARSGKAGQTLTVQVLESEFSQVMSDEAWLSSIEASEFCVPLPKPVTSRPFPAPDPAHIQPYPTPPDDAIVVGIIDDAIAFANHRFRWANGTTRFHDIWQQDGLGPHPTFGYGAEFDAPAINDVLRTAANRGLDESEIYARAGVEDYTQDAHKTLGRRRAHGTHVADLACGFDPGSAPAKEILMGVQLDQAAVRSIHPALLSTYILDALHFIVAKTEALEQLNNTTYAIVVNISFGWYTGPHDGSAPLEKAIDELVQTRSNIKPMHVVLPAGNSRQERTHARLVLSRIGGGNDTRRLNWRLPPDSRAASMMEIWPRRASDDVQLTLQGPGNSVAVTVTSGNTSNILINGQNVGVIDYKSLVGGQGQRGMRIWLAPTASLDPPVATVPFGDWTITIKNARNKRCMLDAWIARSGRLAGWPIFGRQSTFEDPAYERYGPNGRGRSSDRNNRSYVRLLRTLNGITTGKEPVVVGGFCQSDLGSAEYSSLGPARGQAGGGVLVGRRPDVAARSDDSPARHGVLAAGSRTGSVVTQDGTSVAAPQIARWIANELMHNRPAGRAAVGAVAATQEGGRPPLGAIGLAPFPGMHAAGRGRLVYDLALLGWGRTIRR